MDVEHPGTVPAVLLRGPIKRPGFCFSTARAPVSMTCPLIVLRAESPSSLSRHCLVTATCSAELEKSEFGRPTQRREQFPHDALAATLKRSTCHICVL